MYIKAFFLPQGLIIGDVTFQNDQSFQVKNPCMVIPRQTEVVLAPFLQLVDEKEVIIDLNDVAFKQLFTPKIELINHYNQQYGSGLIVSNTLHL